MVSFHLRKGRMFSRRAEEQAMATAQIGVPRDASFIRSGAPEAHAHRAMTNSLPDEDLMLQVREGVGEMLAVLFDRYQRQLFNFYCWLTGDTTAEEELVQVVLFCILTYTEHY